MLALVHTFLTLMLLLVWKGTEQRPTTALRWQTALYLSIQIFIKDGISGREKPAVVGISCDHHKKDKTHSSAVKSQAFPLQEAPDWSGAERALLGGLPTPLNVRPHSHCPAQKKVVLTQDSAQQKLFMIAVQQSGMSNILAKMMRKVKFTYK